MELVKRMALSEYRECREKIVGYQLLHGQEEGWYINEITGSDLIWWYQVNYLKKVGGGSGYRPMVLVSEDDYKLHIALEEQVSAFDVAMHEHWKVSTSVK